ncbi:MAG: PIN domain-containing protein [Candidatus Methylomirabilia bacterium]
MTPENAILVDTDILIDYLRGMPPAIQYLEASGADLCLSVVNVAELHAGVRDHEREAVNALLGCFTIVPLTKRLLFAAGYCAVTSAKAMASSWPTPSSRRRWRV